MYKAINKVGFIDWHGVFHECEYGEHAELAYRLAKELLKLRREEPEDFEIKKIDYSVIRLEESFSGICYVYIPNNVKEVQLNTMLEYAKSASDEMILAIERAYSKWFYDDDSDYRSVEELNDSNFDLYSYYHFGIREDSFTPKKNSRKD